ncbi:tyrosine-type recombinase/integrase [Rhodococcus globerulus]|uniref:Tyrosine-type recombinase/integrase n=1 Tax=Rhodococcus globerulus TaxID=33008 RepID=A0ABU4BSA1_RHOGO|nr:tyrosine-type recombinase/integrase [Rhodococcus globerulus]MDV6267095.1 tyrosine-type recombinase/integrase [Rhodococcus globerulus]
MYDATRLPISKPVATDVVQFDQMDLITAGFLARYSGGTLDSYSTDIRLYRQWCFTVRLDPMQVQRPHLELFARHLEIERGNAPSTVHRRLSCLRMLYRIMHVDGHIDRNPAEYIKMPKVFYDESRMVGLSRTEMSALVSQARASKPSESALITMLALLGLRVTEACNVNVEDFQEYERDHRVLRMIGKGGKPAIVPLPVPVARAMDLAAAGRTSGPLVLRVDGTRMTRRSADRVVKRLAKKAGITKSVSPHLLRHGYVTASLDAGIPLRDVQIMARHSDPRMTQRYDRARGNLDRHGNYALAAFLGGAA